MCWNPSDAKPSDAPQPPAPDDVAPAEAAPGDAAEAPEDELALAGEEAAPGDAAEAPEAEPALAGEEAAPADSTVPHRRWPSRALRVAAQVLAVGLVFAAGFFVHAQLNWPDFHKGPQILDVQKLQGKVTPHEGVTVQASWGDLLPKLVSAGVIDLTKFTSAASRSGQPLTDDQVRLLTEGGEDAIHIDMHNAKFVLNALWAVGLATDSAVLTDGPLTRSQGGGANLASTGGWTLGKQAGPTYIGKLKLIPLTDEQQQMVHDIASGVYRPCCNNPTSFPDCNHGMAALGLAEIMASQGASADEIFDALKSFNAYWFPDQYLTLAVYYKQRGTAWEKVPPRELLDNQHSSGSGWKRIEAAVKEESPLLPKSGGGGCSA